MALYSYLFYNQLVFALTGLIFAFYGSTACAPHLSRFRADDFMRIIADVPNFSERKHVRRGAGQKEFHCGW